MTHFVLHYLSHKKSLAWNKLCFRATSLRHREIKDKLWLINRKEKENFQSSVLKVYYISLKINKNIFYFYLQHKIPSWKWTIENVFSKWCTSEFKTFYRPFQKDNPPKCLPQSALIILRCSFRKRAERLIHFGTFLWEPILNCLQKENIYFKFTLGTSIASISKNLQWNFPANQKKMINVILHSSLKNGPLPHYRVLHGPVFQSRPGSARMATISALPGPKQREKFRPGAGP